VAVGQPVKVIARTEQGVKGATVPRTALTKVGAGETAVWVHTEAERFVARRIRHQSLDAANVAILDGLHDGDRVVTDRSWTALAGALTCSITSFTPRSSSG
jgi:multidrug efflux pump subunit AcrA (membrane-fusion protein)